jgi:hypothetical protein
VGVAAEDAREVVVLLLLRAELHDRRRDGVHRQHGDRRTGRERLVVEDLLLDRRATLAAVLLRPSDAEPAVVAHLAARGTAGGAAHLAADHLVLHLGSHQLREVRAQLVAQRELVGGQPDLQRVPRSVSSRSVSARSARAVR